MGVSSHRPWTEVRIRPVAQNLNFDAPPGVRVRPAAPILAPMTTSSPSLSPFAAGSLRPFAFTSDGGLIRKATPEEDWQTKVETAADDLAPELRDAFVRAANRFRERIDLTALTHAVQTGRAEAVITALGIDTFHEELADLFELLGDGMEAGAKAAIQDAGERHRIEVRMPEEAELSPTVTGFLDHYSMTLIREIGDSTRQGVEAIVGEELRSGRPPDAQARRIREVVGLTERQSRAVANFRRMIEDGDPEVLTRRLRDRRFDPTLVRYIRNGGDAPGPEKVDQMVERYRERFLQHRGETIARTESIRAMNMGTVTAFSILAEQGHTVRLYWLVARDERTCEVCKAIPKLNPDGVEPGAAFITDVGDAMVPPAHPNCRCTLFGRIVSENAYLDALNPAPGVTEGGRFTTLSEQYQRGLPF